VDFICCQTGKYHIHCTLKCLNIVPWCDQAVSVLQVFLQAMEPLADLWQLVKGTPIAENVENLGLALLERAVWDDTLFRAKAVELDAMDDESWVIFPIWMMFSE